MRGLDVALARIALHHEQWQSQPKPTPSKPLGTDKVIVFAPASTATIREMAPVHQIRLSFRPSSAHVWLKQLSDETYSSIEELAAAAKIHPKVVRNRIRLAYLSPNLARAILHGDNHVPTLAELNSTVPLGWHEQEGRMQSKSD